MPMTCEPWFYEAGWESEGGRYSSFVVGIMNHNFHTVRVFYWIADGGERLEFVPWGEEGEESNVGEVAEDLCEEIRLLLPPLP